jgi:hypothetical protein
MSKSKLRICLDVILIVGFYLLIISCSNLNTNRIYVDPTAHPDWIDRSWLTDQPCTAPCWQGLETGKSLRTDALETAHKLSFLGEERTELTDKARVSFLCKYPSDEACASMRFEHGILSDLSLYPNYSITLDQVITQLGSPDSFYYSRRQADVKGCALTVLWFQRRIGLGFGDTSPVKGDDLCDRIYKEAGKLPKGLEVHTVNFLSSVGLKENIQIAQKPETGYIYMLWSGFSE